MINFLYLCFIESVLVYLLNIPKKLLKKYIIVCLLVNIFLSLISVSMLLQDILFLESLSFFIYYYHGRNLTEIIFYISFLLVIKDIVILLPIGSLIVYVMIILLLVYIKHLYPIDNQNTYWGLLMLVSLSTLCIYHILYYDFLDMLGINRNLIILSTLVITIVISYYLFFRYTKMNHETQLLNQAVEYFKNDQENYTFIENKNNELYKLKHNLKYDYLQMKEYVKKKEFENVKEMIDSKIESLDQENILIISGNKLFDSFMNMKIEQLRLRNIKPTIVVSIKDISFIQDEHLNILINYLFDIAMDCITNNQIEIKVNQDNCIFQFSMFISQGIEHIDQVKYDTLKLILKKYQGSIQILKERESIYISLLIPVN